MSFKRTLRTSNGSKRRHKDTVSKRVRKILLVPFTRIVFEKEVGYFFGGKMDDLRVFFEPGHLLLGIDSCVALYLFKSEIQGPVAIKMAEEFFVANGVKGIAISERHDAARLLKHARLNHGINAPANTLKKLGALALQTNFYDAERAVATLPGSKR